VYEVKMQNDPDRRTSMSDILSIRIPTSNGSSVPLSSIGSVEYVGGTRETMSYNKMMAAGCDVMPRDGVPSSVIMKLIEETPLPKGYIIEWGPVQLQEKENEGRLFWLMTAALLFAYLFLVAQYESWTIPVSVMLSVAFALTGAFLGLWLTKTPLSVYAQLGCVMLIGLAAKNAILMVEFSKQERDAGHTVFEAAVRGADLDHHLRQCLCVLGSAHEGTAAAFDVQHDRARTGRQLFTHNRGGDQRNGVDRCGDVAQRIQLFIGGSKIGGLTDDAKSASCYLCGKLVGGERGSVAGEGLQLIDRAARVTESASAHLCDLAAECRGNRRNYEGGFVADTSR
jgi:hypothetical protein